MKTMKKVAVVLAIMLVAVMCFVFTASAEDEFTDGYFTYTITDGKATIIGVDAAINDGALIPSSIGDCPVIGFGTDAFDGCDNLLTVHFIGTQQDWDVLVADNDILKAKTVHFAKCTEQIDPTCNEIGYSEGVHCESCDLWIVECQEIETVAHSFTNYASDKNATFYADGTKTAYCDYGCGEKDTVADEGSKLVLGKPSKVTSTSTTSSITLNWSAVEGATGYRVYYKTSSGWKTTVSKTTKTTYTFKNLKAAARFTFAVKSYRIDGDTTTWAKGYTSHETSTQALTPTKITSTQNDYSIKLSWDAVKGATGYRVYVKTADGWQKRGTVTKTSHKITNLKAGTKYTFAVRPYIRTADKVIWSAYKTYKGATATKSTSVNVYKNAGGSITIGCDNIKGAEGYRLYYKKDGAKSFKLYKTYTKNQKFTFNNLTGGDTYIFVIRAGIRKADGVVWSSYSDTMVTVNYRIKRYTDVINTGKFYFEIYDEMDIYNGVAIKDGSYCLQVKDGNEVQRVVYNAKNKYCYVIDDTSKTYYAERDTEGVAAEAIKAYTDIGAKSKYKTSKEKIGSKTYFVESYKEDGVTVKYYFNGSSLVKEVYIYDGQTLGEVYYSKFTTNVPDSLFTVPSNYKKVTA